MATDSHRLSILTDAEIDDLNHIVKPRIWISRVLKTLSKPMRLAQQRAILELTRDRLCDSAEKPCDGRSKTDREMPDAILTRQKVQNRVYEARPNNRFTTS